MILARDILASSRSFFAKSSLFEASRRGLLFRPLLTVFRREVVEKFSFETSISPKAFIFSLELLLAIEVITAVTRDAYESVGAARAFRIVIGRIEGVFNIVFEGFSIF